MAMSEYARNMSDVDAVISRTNTYYHDLIDWEDAEDPLRKLLAPEWSQAASQSIYGASDEESDYLAQGYRRKYRTTGFLMLPESEAREGLTPALTYISEHPEIRQVVVAGGDCLALPTVKLRNLIEELRKIEHVGIIRLSSKTPVLDPMRIYEDEALLSIIREFSTPAKRIYLMAHIHHPREMTPEATLAIQVLQEAGAIVMNRTPIVGGINDDEAVLASLLDRLSGAGVVPYYFFMDRPVGDHKETAVPLQRAYQLVEEAKKRASGLGQRARLSMNHEAGMVEILAIDAGKAYLKFHASLEDEAGKFMTVPCPPEAIWLDELLGSETPLGPTKLEWSVDAGPMRAQLKTPYEIGD